MITFLTYDTNAGPLINLVRRTKKFLPHLRLRHRTYQKCFRNLSVPSGVLIFTDFDLLSDFEMEAAGSMAHAAEQSGKAVVLNHPAKIRERSSLLRHLHQTGLNSVEVSRLDSEIPTKFPVFIRLECGCEKPDTQLLNSLEEFNQAKSNLIDTGKPLAGRIALSYEAAPDEQGFFRKYGAFRIGDHIVPQHLMLSKDWYVKGATVELNETQKRETLNYVRDNPHRDRLMRYFDEAGHEFGRVDYTTRGNEIVLFEINSNPTFPNFTKWLRNGSERHKIMLDLLVKAFNGLPRLDGAGEIPFTLPKFLPKKVGRSRLGFFSYQKMKWKNILRKKNS